MSIAISRTNGEWQNKAAKSAADLAIGRIASLWQEKAGFRTVMFAATFIDLRLLTRR
jgi:hypothetical protein